MEKPLFKNRKRDIEKCVTGVHFVRCRRYLICRRVVQTCLNLSIFGTIA